MPVDCDIIYNDQPVLIKILVITEAYILKKFKGCPPSLIVHMHPTGFRFDQQDGNFSYKSPMRVFIEHLRRRTIPHEMLEELEQAGTRFYDGETS